MSTRPRRSAAQRASMAITDMADRDSAMTSRYRRLGEGRGSGRAPSADSNMSSVLASGSRKRQSGAASSLREQSVSDGVVHSRRPTRGPKKRYVESESSEDEDEVVVDEEDDDDDDDDDDDEEDEEEEEEEQDEIKVGDSDIDMEADEDVEGEAEDMDVDADGDVDVDVSTVSAAVRGVARGGAVPPPSIKVSKPAGEGASVVTAPRGVGRPPGSGNKLRAPLTSKPGPKSKVRRSAAAGVRSKGVPREEDEEDDDDDEISAFVEVAGADEDDADGDEDDEIDAEGETELVVEDEDDEVDAEGEEIEVMDEDDEDDVEGDGEGDGDAGLSDGEGGSREGTPDLSKMTRRQRARFEETPQEYMKLSDEVQVKKHFTAEELSMRRAEMARRRRNLSEKRNEEVKAETINKLLKRQAPKTTKKNALAGDDSGDEDGRPRPDPTIIRWVSNSKGSRVAVAAELLAGPVGSVFRTSGSAMPPRKVQLVEEVA